MQEQSPKLSAQQINSAFMAHMDTVEPGSGKVPIINGDIITSDEPTVLYELI